MSAIFNKGNIIWICGDKGSREAHVRCFDCDYVHVCSRRISLLKPTMHLLFPEMVSFQQFGKHVQRILGFLWGFRRGRSAIYCGAKSAISWHIIFRSEVLVNKPALATSTGQQERCVLPNGVNSENQVAECA